MSQLARLRRIYDGALLRAEFMPDELLQIFAALPYAAGLYDEMARNERHPLDRKDVADKARASRTLLARFHAEASPGLRPGELAVLERALRFETNRRQALIKPAMSAQRKAELRAEADSVAAIVKKLRIARGIPYDTA